MNAAIYSHYQSTGPERAFPVPADWKLQRLRFAAQINPTSSSTSLPPDTIVSFTPMDSVGEYGGLNLDKEKAIDEVGSGYTYFADGDVVVAKITPCFENGKGALAQGLKNGVAFGTTELHVLRPNADLNGKYLFYLTISHRFRKMGAAHMYGAGGQKRVPELFIKDVLAPIPPLAEQHAIVRFLDAKTAQIKDLIAKKEHLLALLAEKRAAVITETTTKGTKSHVPMKEPSVPWLGAFPAHWDLVPLKWRCRITSSQVDPTEPGLRGLPLIAPDHIESGTGRLLPFGTAEEQGAISGKYRFRKGCLLYSKIRPELSKACIAPVDGLCSADMYAIEPTRALIVEFLLYQFLSKHFHQFTVLESMRVAMPKVNREALGSFPLLIPPIEEQRAIVRAIQKNNTEIDRLAGKIQEHLSTLREYHSSLIAHAVTGEIDVRSFGLEKAAQ